MIGLHAFLQIRVGENSRVVVPSCASVPQVYQYVWVEVGPRCKTSFLKPPLIKHCHPVFGVMWLDVDIRYEKNFDGIGRPIWVIAAGHYRRDEKLSNKHTDDERGNARETPDLLPICISQKQAKVAQSSAFAMRVTTARKVQHCRPAPAKLSSEPDRCGYSARVSASANSPIIRVVHVTLSCDVYSIHSAILGWTSGNYRLPPAWAVYPNVLNVTRGSLALSLSLLPRVPSYKHPFCRVHFHPNLCVVTAMADAAATQGASNPAAAQSSAATSAPLKEQKEPGNAADGKTELPKTPEIAVEGKKETQSPTKRDSDKAETSKALAREDLTVFKATFADFKQRQKTLDDQLRSSLKELDSQFSRLESSVRNHKQQMKVCFFVRAACPLKKC